MTDRIVQKEETEAVRTTFKIECRTCGSDQVEVIENVEVADDGDGRTDVWGDLNLECSACGAKAKLRDIVQ